MSAPTETRLQSSAIEAPIVIEEDSTVTNEVSDKATELRIEVSEELQSFWRDRDWPEDILKKHIFLAAAVDLLGAARFEKDWIGVVNPTSPQAYDQRGQIFRELTELLANGDLTTYTQPVVGGAFEPIDAHIWNFKNYRSRFKYCRIDRKNPFRNVSGSKSGSYLFLSRTELEALIQSFPHTQLGIGDFETLPRFLQASILTARALNITCDSPPLATDVIEKEFRRVTRQLGIEAGVSVRLVKYACTILRPPGAGRSKKSALKK